MISSERTGTFIRKNRPYPPVATVIHPQIEVSRALRRLSKLSIRTTRKIVEFSNPFSIEGAGRVLPAGNYEIVTDEELIEGLSFPVYRRVATMMLAYTKSSPVPSTEMLNIDPRDLAAAIERDRRTVKATAASAKQP